MCSCSNPEEGMEKWDFLSRNTDRRRYVLTTSILEEKLAEAKVAVNKKNARAKIQIHLRLVVTDQ